MGTHPNAFVLAENEGRTDVENVTAFVMDALIGNLGNLGWNEVTKKVVSFGADGVPMFQGHRIGIISRLHNNHAPFM